MPNTKQSKKRLAQDVLKRSRNDRRKLAIKKHSRAFEDFIKATKKADAEKVLPKLYKAIDKAAKHDTIHKNKASRQKAKFARMLANME